MVTTNPQNTYLRDLLAQPQAVRDTLAGLRGQSIPESVSQGVMDGRFRRIVLTGMGSSYHAFHPLQQALVRRGREAYLVETSELIYSLPGLLQPDTLVIAASQSGRSAEIGTLADRKDAGFTLLGVTNTEDSPLTQAAHNCLVTRAGEETTVSCKTYLATLLALAWLEPALAGESPAPVLKELEAAVPAVESYLASWQAHVADLKKRLKDIRDVFVAGRGVSLAAAGTGGLIIKESTHLHGEGMSSAAFRHGPFEMVSPQAFVLVFEGAGEAAALNRRLAADVLTAGGAGALVAGDAPEAVFRLPGVAQAALPLVEILPVQMMTLALAELRGHTAGQFTHATKVTTTE